MIQKIEVYIQTYWLVKNALKQTNHLFYAQSAKIRIMMKKWSVKMDILLSNLTNTYII